MLHLTCSGMVLQASTPCPHARAQCCHSPSATPPQPCTNNHSHKNLPCHGMPPKLTKTACATCACMGASHPQIRAPRLARMRSPCTFHMRRVVCHLVPWLPEVLPRGLQGGQGCRHALVSVRAAADLTMRVQCSMRSHCLQWHAGIVLWQDADLQLLALQEDCQLHATVGRADLCS